MSYQLKITKTVVNPDYEKQYEDWRREHGRYNNMLPSPSPTIEQKVLETTVTDEVFAAIQKAALAALGESFSFARASNNCIMKHLHYLVTGLAVILGLYANYEAVGFVRFLINQSSDVMLFMGLATLMLLVVTDLVAVRALLGQFSTKEEQ